MSSVAAPTPAIPSFPLYDTMASATATQKDMPLTNDDTTFFFTHIHKVVDYELFYMLIRMYAAHDPTTDATNRLPYGGKQWKKGLRFDMARLPTHLQQILVAFLRTYLAHPQQSTI
jgi:hypothetical protein